MLKKFQIYNSSDTFPKSSKAHVPKLYLDRENEGITKAQENNKHETRFANNKQVVDTKDMKLTIIRSIYETGKGYERENEGGFSKVTDLFLMSQNAE